jgi:hypothetical protein
VGTLSCGDGAGSLISRRDENEYWLPGYREPEEGTIIWWANGAGSVALSDYSSML